MITTLRNPRKRNPSISKSSISFGIAGIDALIDPYSLSYQVGDDSPSVTCVVGPDGVGKSILGLSAASIYAAANHKDAQARVIYASTDLNVVQARRTFNHFGLDQPRRRREVLRSLIEELYFDPNDVSTLRKRDQILSDECQLRWLSPFPDQVHAELRDNKEHPASFSSIFDSQESSHALSISWIWPSTLLEMIGGS